jgi:uncharacterized DUF497 family protein
MADLEFTWDETKARSNAKKHGVSFDQAQSVFSDERARVIDDPDHSDEEDRFILLGMSSKPRVLIVVYAYRDKAAQIRLISARKATPQERALYNQKARS